MEPNQTLYIKNLNDKINKHEVKRLLYHLFSAYGYILEISVSKSQKMRGQSFVVFDNMLDATLAKQALQNFSFLDKPLVIDYAREKSDSIARRDGVYESTNKLKREAERKAEKKAKIQEKIEKVNKELDKIISRELRVINLHPDLRHEDLTVLFNQFEGLLDVKIENNEAKVTYESQKSAEMALASLNGFKITQENSLIISYVP